MSISPLPPGVPWLCTFKEALPEGRTRLEFLLASGERRSVVIDAGALSDALVTQIGDALASGTVAYSPSRSAPRS